MSDRLKLKSTSYVNTDEIKNVKEIEEKEVNKDMSNIIRALEDINYTLQTLTHIIRNK